MARVTAGASDSFARPSASAVDRARLLLERALGPSKVATSRDVCERYAATVSTPLK